jgi:hypothetical protein
MAEKTESKNSSLAEYRELLVVYRDKLLWAREYL